MGTDTYSADLYSGWQRGSNEYHNGLLRRHFPKGTDFSKATQAGIIEMVKEINERLRKCLGDYTPNEVFLRELNRGGVAIRY